MYKRQAEDKLKIVAGSQMPQFTDKVQGLEVGDVFTTEPIMTTQAENTNGVGEHEIVISGCLLYTSRCV